MIVLDLSEQVVEAQRDMSHYIRLVTCGLEEAEDIVQMVGGDLIPPEVANRLSSSDRKDYVVRERTITSIGQYRIVSQYRGGKTRQFDLIVDMADSGFDLHLTASEKTHIIYEDMRLEALPNKPAVLHLVEGDTCYRCGGSGFDPIPGEAGGDGACSRCGGHGRDVEMDF
jgi:hypothetical protein